ncbi:MAG: hypothetical protein KatS3mg108_0687 [Isosphaeraceae bacterium]|nr:MAG: hypothetical protein KatS3mg108_0687 [Isosphaeraceae bacterium]
MNSTQTFATPAVFVEFGVDGVDPVAVAGRDDDAEAGMAQVVVELLAAGILAALVQEVAECVPVFADGLRSGVGVQDVAGIADPAQSGVDADLPDLFADVGSGFHGGFLSG